MWHRIAPQLAERFTLVVPDCPVHVLANRHHLVRPGQPSLPPSAWQRTFALHATGTTIDAAHVPDEVNPDATLAALLAFLPGTQLPR